MPKMRVRAVMPAGSKAWTDEEVSQVLGTLPGFQIVAAGEIVTFLFDVEIPSFLVPYMATHTGVTEAAAMDQILHKFSALDKLTGPPEPPFGTKITVEKFYDYD